MTITAGTKLGRYEVRSQLGAGGMGEVYLAQDTKLDRKVALKVLPADLAANQDRMRRFTQEAKSSAALNHPNIAHIYEIGESEGVNFIAMEFINGQTLRGRMHNVPMKLGEGLDVAIQSASALAAAHAAGIVHRDIKPENIMLRRDGIVKVLDFGLAKLIAEAQARIDTQASTRFKTDPGTVVGTAIYMSPEQARGLDVDARTDIWSLGVVLYEMVAGCLPFAGSTSSEVMASILGDKEPQPLARYSRDVPAELERIVSKALRKNRDERHQTIKDMLLDLKSLKQELEFERKLERSVPPRAEAATSTSQAAEPSGRDLPSRAITNGELVLASAARTASVSSVEYIVGGIKQHKRGVVVALSILLLAALGTGYWLFIHRSSNETTIESIAVLPFVNASTNTDVEYLSDGMTESLIDSLSQLPHLSVKARSSVFRYKGKEVDSQQVAAELSVQAILNGRVVQRGDDLTLYLSLVDARNGNQLWGEQYKRKLADLVSLQSEIARDVSEKLRLRLSGEDKQRLTKRHTENAEAYELYLKGRYYMNTLSSEGAKGLGYFQRAIELDPNYGQAYTGLAEAYASIGSLGATFTMPPKEAFSKAKAAALKAVELDDTLAEAHTALGLIAKDFDWDWNSAEREFKRAIALNPNYVPAHHWYSHYLISMGRFEESLAESQRALALDPLDVGMNLHLGMHYYSARQYDQAIAQLQKALDMNRNHSEEHGILGLVYAQKGRYTEAIAEQQKSRELGGLDNRGSVGHMYAISGQRGEAQKLLDQLQEESKHKDVSPYSIAKIYEGLGEKDQAFVWLEKAYTARDSNITNPGLKVDPEFDRLHSDPRFADLLRRIGLPQ